MQKIYLKKSYTHSYTSISWHKTSFMSMFTYMHMHMHMYMYMYIYMHTYIRITYSTSYHVFTMNINSEWTGDFGSKCSFALRSRDTFVNSTLVVLENNYGHSLLNKQNYRDKLGQKITPFYKCKNKMQLKTRQTFTLKISCLQFYPQVRLFGFRHP